MSYRIWEKISALESRSPNPYYFLSLLNLACDNSNLGQMQHSFFAEEVLDHVKAPDNMCSLFSFQ